MDGVGAVGVVEAGHDAVLVVAAGDLGCPSLDVLEAVGSDDVCAGGLRVALPEAGSGRGLDDVDAAAFRCCVQGVVELDPLICVVVGRA